MNAQHVFSKKLISMIFFWCIALETFSSSSKAALSCVGAPTSITINVGTVISQKDTAIDSSITPEIIGANGGYDCSKGSGSSGMGIKSYLKDTGKKNASYASLFSSNVPGVSMTIGVSGAIGLKWIGDHIGYLGGANWRLVNFSAGSESWPLGLQARIQLYKTGDINSGTLSGQIGAYIASNGSSPTAWGPEIPIYITGTITKVACSLSSTSINVPLGDVLISKFTGVGVTAADKSFDLGLTCDKDAKINVSLAGTQNTDTIETSVLALTSAGQTGTASGVGVQLLYGGTPLKINNNILLKTSAGGQETLPFTARYYQTKATVGAGLANSSATLNITYQ
ncbi:fimbrial protein [Serratia proteamaculans]|uniref:fimbrial protein n=1 Tax=Serratia proteamaculans TaxID=28151 RepID=UPI00217A071A|nr:fimbrial protein [Serratia proteamaculans]CAI1573104.1 Type-1A pilin [Serratia proteamaculans]